MKNLLLVDATGRIVFLSDTYEGSVHDKAIADTLSYPLPPESVLYQDLGFQGYTISGVTIQQPHKKSRGGQLTDEQKAENRALAQVRIQVEHAINGAKRCRIVHDKLRLWRAGIRDTVMAICSGLHNLRVETIESLSVST